MIVMRRTVVVPSVAVALFVVLGAACGSSGGSASSSKSQQDAVCNDASTLKPSLHKLGSDVQSDIDGVKKTLDGLQSATSFSDIQSTLTTAKTQIENSVDSLTKTLKC